MSDEPKDGGSVFARPPCVYNSGETAVEFWPAQDGMSLRDYFAAAALTGLIASFQGESGSPTPKETAELCCAYADAMLNARK